MKQVRVALLGSIALSCAGEDLRLGGAPPQKSELRFDSIEISVELSADNEDENPTLTADELHVCFTTSRDGGMGSRDIWCAERSSLDEAFSEPVPSEELNTSDFESSSALSLDGLTIWFGSEREGGQGGVDIYSATRTSVGDSWGDPSLVEELNSEEDDIPRPPGQGGLVMPIASRRAGGIYRTLFAERGSSDDAFGEPFLIEEINPEGMSVADAFLSEDGLLLIYAMRLDADDDEDGDLYFSTRSSMNDSFSTPRELSGINTPDEERDPWLSPDGETLYFASDRSGDLDIYTARRVR
jgi:hypothetical protein